MTDAEANAIAIMNYNRTTPSTRYLELQDFYRTIHEKGETFLGMPPERTFPSKSLPSQAGRINRLIDQTKAQTILHYGSGKGKQSEPYYKLTD